MVQKNPPPEVRVITPEDVQTFPDLDKVRGRAKEQGLGLGVVAYRMGDEGYPQISKRRHDLRAALRTIELTLEQLDEGYHFDDALAQEKIASIRRAAGVLNREAQVLLQLYTPDENGGSL